MKQSVINMRRKFLKALRSGKYIKGQGNLVHTTKHGTTYCVLGVLWVEAYPEKSLDDAISIYEKVNDLLGVPKIGNKLWNWNDDSIRFSGRHYSFADIADMFEKEVFPEYPIKLTWWERFVAWIS